MIRINLLQERKAPARGKTKSAGPSVPGRLPGLPLLAPLRGRRRLRLRAAWWWIKSSQDQGARHADRRRQKRQQDLQAIKNQVDEFQAKKTLLENKVTLIETLKVEQKGPVHMLDEISKALPDFVWLTAMDQNATGGLKFNGREQRPHRGGRLHQRPPAQRLVPRGRARCGRGLEGRTS